MHGRDRRRDSLSRALVEAGLITADDIQVASKEATRIGVPLASAVVSLGLATEVDVAITMAQRLGHIYIDLDEYPIDPEAVALLPEEHARRYLALPVEVQEGGGVSSSRWWIRRTSSPSTMSRSSPSARCARW